MPFIAQQVTVGIDFKLDSIQSVVLTHICFSSTFILIAREGEMRELSPLSHCLPHWLSQAQAWGQAGTPAPTRSL